MLPWWFWVLLWIVLILGMLLFLVLAAIKLFRGFMKLMDEVSEASERIGEALESPAGPIDYGILPERGPSGVAALFQEPEDARALLEAGKAQRIETRRVRRVKRKTLRGQPQRVADLDLF